LAILLQCDTGKWDSDVGETEIGKFGKASKSKTKLIFVFSNTEYWAFGKVLESENLKNEYSKTFEISENEKSLYCMVFDINNFKNKESTDDSIREFIKYLKSKKVNDLNIIDDL
jgi:hypothetical protein